MGTSPAAKDDIFAAEATALTRKQSGQNLPTHTIKHDEDRTSSPRPRGRSSDSEGRSRASERGSSEERSDVRSDQRKEAKKLVQEFTTEMVKGKQYDVVLPSGQLRPRYCMLTRKLDAFRIKSSKEASDARNIPLTSIDEIVAGADNASSLASRGLETPLEDLSVTLVLSDQ